MRKIKVAVVQFDSILGHIEENSLKVKETIGKVLKEYPESNLIVFPEMCLYGYSKLEEIRSDKYEKEIDQALESICHFARESKVAVVIGYARRVDTKKIYNSIVYINSKGTMLCTYDKIHLITSESTVFERGNEYVILDTEYGKFGFLICWDCSFPETARLYAKNGVELLIIPAAWEKLYSEQWETAIKARAFDNGIFVIGANRVGRDDNTDFCGKSMLVDRMGRVVVSTVGNEISYVYSEIDFNNSMQEREEIGMPLLELRQESYEESKIRYIGVCP